MNLAAHGFMRKSKEETKEEVEEGGGRGGCLPLGIGTKSGCKSDEYCDSQRICRQNEQEEGEEEDDQLGDLFHPLHHSLDDDDTV